MSHKQQVVNIDESDMSTVCAQSKRGSDGGSEVDARTGGGPCSCGKNCCMCCNCCFQWRSLVILGGFLLMGSLPSVMLQPIMPEMKKKYFGSDAKAAMFQSISDGTIALINTILCGAFAQLLDTIGRRPFFLAQAGFSLLNSILVLIFQHTPPVWMISMSFSRIVQGSFLLAWISDQYTPEQRPRAYAVNQAVGLFAVLPVLIVVASGLPHTILFAISVAVALITLIYAFFLIPESYPKPLRKKFNEFGITTFTNPFKTLKFLCVSRTIAAMSVILALAATAQIGTQEVTIYWVDSRVGYGPIDIAIGLAEMAILVPPGLIFILPILLRYLSPIMILMMSLTALCAAIVLIATIWAKWVMFAFVQPLLIVEVWAVPVIYSMMANSGGVADQARRMTAMQVVIDLCSAAGPLLFGIAYGELSGTMVLIPFGCCLLLCIISGFITMRLAKWYEIDILNKKGDEEEDSEKQKESENKPLLSEGAQRNDQDEEQRGDDLYKKE